MTDMHPGAPAQLTFAVTVIFDPSILSARRISVIKKACKRYGISHRDPNNADKAAATISRLRDVDRCIVTQVIEKHCATFREGVKS